MIQHFLVKALRGIGHEVHAFYRNAGVLPLLGRASEHWLGRGVSQRVPRLNPDYQLRNRQLEALARRLRPEVILMTGGNEMIYPATLARLKAETGALIVCESGDSPVVFSHANERHAARHYDLAVVNDFYHGIQWQELGAARMVCLPISGCDPEFHHPYELSDEERRVYNCDVGFVGTLAPAHLYHRRVHALSALRDCDLGIWSVHDVPALLEPYNRGAALGQEMLRVLSAARIAINIHGDFMLYGGNMRLFELAAIGAFQIADDLPGIREWFTPGENIVTFTDAADLRDKVAYYLAHPEERQQIAEAARQHVYQHHSYNQRAKQMVALIEEIRQTL